MNPHEITLVRASYYDVCKRSPHFGATFYANLFAAAPSLAALFERSIAHQGVLLSGTLAVVVNGLDDLPRIQTVVSSLGARHRRYGVEREHYAVATEVLIATLRQCREVGLPSSTEQAWRAACAEIFGFMAAGSSDGWP